MRHSGAMSASELRFAALGPLRAWVDGEPVELGPAKQRAVLATLLLAAPDAVTVERLTDAVWPAGGPRDPLRNLQVYVSSLRRALGNTSIVTVDRAYRLVVPDGHVDVARFESLARTAQDQQRDGRHAEAVESADAALDLWSGEAWQDVRDSHELEAYAHRLDASRVDVRAVRASSLLALGRHRDLVPELEALVRDHPLREDLRGHLMVALHRCGRQSEALAGYAAARELLVAETGLEPGAELRELQVAILREDPRLEMEDAELRSRRHLPAPTSPIIGRRSDVDQLVAALRGTSRLVTVTGTGGIGKTRVALEVARELTPDFPDGVWFVPLAELTDHRLVPQAIAEALDVEPAGSDFVRPLVDHVAERRLLLVLDNFEQVDAAAPLVGELVAAVQDLRVLVTSRTPLLVYGEQLHDLDPLPLDDAVTLFATRARQADRRFDTSRDQALREVSAALDGLPLALELVAARVGELDLGELMGRMGERLDLAAAGPRDRTARQQTLRSAIAWSVDLLSEEEARDFTRLGVFAGGCTVEAAAAVAGVSRERLTRLARCSLVLRADGRFRMLETVRDYAVELLDAEAPDLRDRHAAHYLALAEQARAGMKKVESSALVHRLLAERANLRAALEHLDAHGSDEELLRMAASLAIFWFRTSPASEDVSWVTHALAKAPGASPHLRARGWYGLGICRSEQGRTDEGLAAFGTALELFSAAADDVWMARTLNSLGGTTYDQGRVAEAVPLMDENIAIRRRLQHPELPLGVALTNRALAAIHLHDWPTAHSCLEEARSLAGDDDLEIALLDSALADLAVEEGDVALASGLLATAVPVLREHDQTYRLIECLDTCAALAVLESRLREAAVLVGAADRALQEDGSSLVPADATWRERRILLALNGLDHGTRRAAAAEGGRLDLDAALDLAMAVVGDTLPA